MQRFFGDVRDLVSILISAIYNASPEYVFEVERFDSERSSVTLRGVRCRGHAASRGQE